MYIIQLTINSSYPVPTSFKLKLEWFMRSNLPSGFDVEILCDIEETSHPPSKRFCSRPAGWYTAQDA